MLNQKGGMQIMTYLLIIAIVVGGYIGIKAAPPYIHKFQLDMLADFISKMAADPVRRKDVRLTLLKRIADNDLPVTADDFTVEIDQEEARVSVDYETEVEFIPENDLVPPVIREYSFHVEAVHPVKR